MRIDPAFDPWAYVFQRKPPDYVVRGYDVHVSDATVNACTGNEDATVPMACCLYDYDVIVLNASADNRAPRETEAICYHEAGHLELGHVPGCEIDFSTQEGQDLYICQEIAADEYAASYGYGIFVKKFLWTLAKIAAKNGDADSLLQLNMRVLAIDLFLEAHTEIIQHTK